MKVHILIDNPKSWMVPYGKELSDKIASLDHECALLFDHDSLCAGEILILLSCEKILNSEKRSLHKHNLVVHESSLPQGKGWSPVTWQILEGKNEIPVSLIEADEKVDNGVIYAQMNMKLKGNELIEDIRKEQYRVTKALILDFLSKYPNVQGKPQSGSESFYTKRNLEDSKLNPDLSIREQFNLLRVVDNERYPAFFTIGEDSYTVRIERKKVDE